MPRPVTDVTAARIVTTLPAKVALLEAFNLVEKTPHDWTISVRPYLGHVWVLQWDRVALTVGDLGDLEYARRAAAEARGARYDLRLLVLATANALGLPERRYRRPAGAPIVNAALTRCPGCGCNVIAARHRPGSELCRDAARDRAESIAV